MALIETVRPVPIEKPHFKRFFLCFEAQRVAYMDGCIPFIGLDGTHLKGAYGDVMLTTISIDTNNGIIQWL